MAFMNFDGPNFTMEVPTNWIVTSSPQFQAIFLGPNDPLVRSNLVISLRPVEANVTYQAVGASAREAQEREYPQYQILQEIDFGAQGGTGMLRHYRWVNAENNATIIQVQAFFVVGQILFTLTGTRGAHLGVEAGQEVDEIFNHMIQTFRITQ